MPSTAAASDPIFDLVAQVRASQLPPPDQRREIRMAAKVSVRRGAKAHGVSPMTFLRWEKGDVTPRLEDALRYRRFLDELRRAVEP
jgi:DNA-binding XRE family transcriptional regulator